MEIAPGDQAFRLVTGFRTSQAVVLAIELGIPDRVADGPQKAADLARAVGVNEDSLRRLLRFLCALGVLREDGGDRFGPTELSACLRAGQREHEMARMVLGEGYAAWGELGYSVRSGKPAYEVVHGMPRWEHLAGNPDASRRFNAAMAASAEIDARALLAACDLAGVSTLTDVGGGRGALMAVVLAAHPEMRGVIVDLKPGLEGAHDHLEAAGVADRCELVVGNFFEAVPAGADVYLLRWILHDWNDEQAAQIVGVCARAMPPDGRLLVIDRLMPDRIQTTPADLRKVMADLHMMVILGGRERTEAEFRALFAGADLALMRMAPLPTGTSLLEVGKTGAGLRSPHERVIAGT